MANNILDDLEYKFDELLIDLRKMEKESKFKKKQTQSIMSLKYIINTIHREIVPPGPLW